MNSLVSAVGELGSGIGGSHNKEEEGRVEEDVLGEDQCARLCTCEHMDGRRVSEKG